MDVAAKQQVVERVKQAQNILVTVSTNPSVDQLAACVGLTLLLNKMGKHATAVFSGQIPSTLEFLQPEKTIEHNTDSLRDFIISLDKEKADKLRYKVEDEVVKIFITPYRTSLSEKDLVFSQGDFNVEVVMALGVKDRNQLDTAITAHGRILHDATIISVNDNNSQAPNIGQINWQEPTASSLSEMLVSISEAFGPNLIDNQMATAFLTGIVSATKRFSNTKTTPKVMTMSAQLMAAGANQQLIVSKLEPPVPVWTPGSKPVAAPVIEEDTISNKKPEGTLTVNHKAAPAAEQVDVSSSEIHIDKDGNLHTKKEEQNLALNPTTAPIIETIAESEPSSGEQSVEAPEAEPLVPGEPSDSIPPSSMPGSHSVLSPLNGGPALEAPFTANTQPEWSLATGSTDPFSQPDTLPNPGFLTHAPAVKPSGTSGPSVISTSNQVSLTDDTSPPPIDQARSAVDNALAAAPFSPELSPVQALNANPLGEELHPPEVKVGPSDDNSSTDFAPPSPPPLPPPLMPSPGIVIPSQPYRTSDKSSNNS